MRPHLPGVEVSLFQASSSPGWTFLTGRRPHKSPRCWAAHVASGGQRESHSPCVHTSLPGLGARGLSHTEGEQEVPGNAQGGLCPDATRGLPPPSSVTPCPGSLSGRSAGPRPLCQGSRPSALQPDWEVSVTHAPANPGFWPQSPSSRGRARKAHPPWVRELTSGVWGGSGQTFLACSE